MNRSLRIAVGALLCATLLLAPWLLLRYRGAAEGAFQARPAAGLWNYWTGEQRTLTLSFAQPTDVAVGDPVFMRDGTSSLAQVGHVELLLDHGNLVPAERALTSQAQVVLYPQAPSLAGYAIVYRTTPESFTWVVSTLLPPERREQVTAEIERVVTEYQDEMTAALRPVIESTVQDLWRIVREDGIAALDRERPTFEHLIEKYQQQIIDDQLAPLAREEIWPVVRQRAQPVATEVGRELWRRLSLWRFGWRAAYDILPLVPDKKLVESEWSRFVEQEALPVLEQHTDEFVKLIVDVLGDLASNPKVGEALRHSVEVLEQDPELRALARKLLDEVIVHNPRVRTCLAEHLTGDDMQRALAVADARFEPAARKIGDLLFGTQQEGLTPEFAHVVRTQILHKNQRWFLLEKIDDPAAGDEMHRLPNTLRVHVGGETEN